MEFWRWQTLEQKWIVNYIYKGPTAQRGQLSSPVITAQVIFQSHDGSLEADFRSMTTSTQHLLVHVPFTQIPALSPAFSTSSPYSSSWLQLVCSRFGNSRRVYSQIQGLSNSRHRGVSQEQSTEPDTHPLDLSDLFNLRMPPKSSKPAFPTSDRLSPQQGKSRLPRRPSTGPDHLSWARSASSISDHHRQASCGPCH